MRILLVDDESKKLKSLSSAIHRIEGVRKDNFEHVLDLMSAKEKMKEICYDLVVLDLKIEEYLGQNKEMQTETAGLDFIEEIFETDSLRTPREIIILTEHDELQKKCTETEKNLEYQILKYDEQSLEWEKIIVNKIKYIQKYEESQTHFIKNMKCDVAIICAVANEREALERAFEDCSFENINFDNDSNDYYYGELPSGIRLIYAQQREMGMTAAACLTQNLISHFSPHYIIMVGIAAGIGEGKNFGDIIAATEVWNYTSGKYKTAENGDVIFAPDPKSISLTPDIDKILRRKYDEELYKISKKWREDIKNVPQLILGPLACGTAVVGNSKVIDEMIKDHSRKTVGLDMESYGLFYAATYGLNNKTIPICLKSISDFADEDKGDGYQKYASYTSAEFAKYLIENVLDYAETRAV